MYLADASYKRKTEPNICLSKLLIPGKDMDEWLKIVISLLSVINSNIQ